MSTTKQPSSVTCIRFVRLLVTIFLPWIALRKARAQLHLAALVLRNEARSGANWMLPNGENETLLRWADELEHDGWVICKPNALALATQGAAESNNEERKDQSYE